MNNIIQIYDDADLVDAMAAANRLQFPKKLTYIEEPQIKTTHVVDSVTKQVILSFDWSATFYNPHRLAAYFTFATPDLVFEALTELMQRRNAMRPTPPPNLPWEPMPTKPPLPPADEILNVQAPAHTRESLQAMIEWVEPAATAKSYNLRKNTLELSDVAISSNLWNNNDIFTRDQVEAMFAIFISKVI